MTFCLGGLIFIIYGMIQISLYSKISVSPFEAEPEEVAYAFAYNLDREDYDGATAYYDSYANLGESAESIEDLRNSVGIPQGCRLLKNKKDHIRVNYDSNIYRVEIPYRCDKGEDVLDIYVTDGTWETPNGAGKFVVSIAAGKAGYPL